MVFLKNKRKLEFLIESYKFLPDYNLKLFKILMSVFIVISFYLFYNSFCLLDRLLVDYQQEIFHIYNHY